MKLVLFDNDSEVLDLLYLSAFGDYYCYDSGEDGYIDVFDNVSINIFNYDFKNVLFVSSADVNLDGYLDIIDYRYISNHYFET